jgi:hypothetical protein
MNKKPSTERNNNKYFNYNILTKVFYCCSGLKENSPELLFEMEDLDNMNNINNKNNTDEINNTFPMLSKYIRQDEKNKIKYSKKGILDFIQYLQKEEYSKKYESDNYAISIKDSSKLSKDSLLIRYEAKIDKKLFISEVPKINEIFDAIKNPYKNLRWNIYNKEYIIIQNINENVDIAKKITVKLMNIIPEKEFYNKRIYFINEGIIYFFSSSIPDDIYPPKDENFRAINYFEIYIIKEDNSYYWFDIFQQIDIKMSIPQTFLMLNLPEKLTDYFDKLINFFNS